MCGVTSVREKSVVRSWGSGREPDYLGGWGRVGKLRSLRILRKIPPPERRGAGGASGVPHTGYRDEHAAAAGPDALGAEHGPTGEVNDFGAP